MDPSSRVACLEFAVGSEVSLPDLRSLYPQDWPCEMNSNYKTVKRQIDRWLASILPPKMAKKAAASDFTLLGAYYFPTCDQETFLACNKWLIWAFLWDDVLDNGELVDDLRSADKYRCDSKRYLRQCLLDDDGLDTAAPPRLVQDFSEIAQCLRKRCRRDQLTLIYDEMALYMDQTAEEQRHRNSHTVLDVDTFWGFRQFTAAVRPFVAAQQADLGLQCPAYLLECNPELHTVWAETTAQVIYVNELTSLKKEIASGQVENLVPLLGWEVGSIEDAVQRTVTALEKSIHAMALAEQNLAYQLRAVTSEDAYELQRFVHGCKNFAHGNVYWHYETARYGMQGQEDHDGSVTYRLETQ